MSDGAKIALILGCALVALLLFYRSRDNGAMTTYRAAGAIYPAQIIPPTLPLMRATTEPQQKSNSTTRNNKCGCLL